MRCAKEQRMHFKISSLNQSACRSVPNEEAYERRPLLFDFFTRDSFFPPFYTQLPIHGLLQTQQDYHVNRQLARSLFFLVCVTDVTLLRHYVAITRQMTVLWPNEEAWITAWMYYLLPRNKIQVNFKTMRLHCCMGYKNIIVLIVMWQMWADACQQNQIVSEWQVT
jgi:hypothetical protein